MEVAASLEIVGLGNLRAISSFARREISFTSDDRLDTGLARLREEFDRPEHIAVVGHGHRRHSGLLRMLDQRTDFVGAVEQALLSMNVQMNETHAMASTSASQARRSRLRASASDS